MKAYIWDHRGGGFIMIHPVFWGHDLRVTNLFFFGGGMGWHMLTPQKGKWNFGRVILTLIPAHPIQSKKTYLRGILMLFFKDIQDKPRVWRWCGWEDDLSVPGSHCPYHSIPVHTSCCLHFVETQDWCMRSGGIFPAQMPIPMHRSCMATYPNGQLANLMAGRFSTTIKKTKQMTWRAISQSHSGCMLQS